MYPGAFSSDSAAAFSEARSRLFSDHHPPMMAWLWGFFPYQGSLLLFHLTLFFCCIFTLGLITRRAGNIWPYAGFFLIAVPPVLALLDCLWKDTSMMLTLMFAFLLMLCKRTLTGPATTLVLTLFFYATAVRHNAIFAIFPLSYWLVTLSHGTQPVWRNMLLALLMGVTLFAGKTAFEKQVVINHIEYSQENMLFDLGFMSQRLNKPLLPVYVYRDAQLNHRQFLRKEHFSWEGHYMSNNYGTTDHEKHLELRKAYMRMILNHPLDYLAHRWDMFRGVLSLNGYTYWSYMFSNASHTPFMNAAETYLKQSEQSLWFKGYLWLTLNLALLLVTLKKSLPFHLRRGVFYLNLSALFYHFSNFLFVPSGDFRYNAWPMAAALFSILLLTPVFLARRRFTES